MTDEERMVLWAKGLKAVELGVLAFGKAQTRDDVNPFLMGMFTTLSKEVLLEARGSEAAMQAALDRRSIEVASDLVDRPTEEQERLLRDMSPRRWPPNVARFSATAKDRRAIENFIEWLEENDFHIRKRVPGKYHDAFWAPTERLDVLILQHQDIDPQELERERRALLDKERERHGE